MNRNAFGYFLVYGAHEREELLVTVPVHARTDYGAIQVGSGQSIEHGADRGANQDTGRIDVDLLGGLCVRAGGTNMGPRELVGAKPRHVLVALLLNGGTRFPRTPLVPVVG